MALSKKDRKKVYEKSNGFCWYCGCDISEMRWQADHVKPIYRNWDIKPKHAGEDTLENLVPTCAKCNNHKHSFSVEDFRREISLQVERARKSSTNFRTAERYGMIEVIEKPIVFWFEENRL
jgi:5-methylcytosine-specific restriction endonuclease McrA